jgi:hypothetical protein
MVLVSGEIAAQGSGAIAGEVKKGEVQLGI